MKLFRPITKDDISLEAYHKGLSYAKVKLVAMNEKNQVFYSYKGDRLRHHGRWANIKEFVIKI